MLDDYGGSFRRADNVFTWFLPRKEGDLHGLRWIVLALRSPVDGGDLLDHLSGSAHLRKRLVIVVSARHLRRAGAHLSRGLSWERTAEHLRSALDHHAPLQRLARARHLVVTFENDGAMLVDRSGRKPLASVLFDSGRAEGEWAERRSGEVFGSSGCVTAAVACHLALQDDSNADLAPAVAQGLAAMRCLHDEGHGTAISEKGVRSPGTGFPYGRVAAALRNPPYRFSRATVPADDVPWTILDSLQDARAERPLHGFARQLAIRGEKVLEHVPHLRVAGLLTADRAEIETLRSLRRILVAYRDTSAGRKPLSLGVFGAPGSGKSFGVEQLAVGVFGEPGAPRYDGWLEFNLSQFDDASDLAGALHQVRDRRLQGVVPVVFFDEFDSQQYRWLRHLLAPMQDGRFQQGTSTHTIGKCVFVFAGGTSHTFEAFGESDSPEAKRHFVLAKGPDFKSRLDGYLNVLGPNPSGASDRNFPVRRAFMVRNMLGCRPDEQLDIDPGVLTALLEVSAYAHGARSLGKVLEPLASARRASQATLQRWQLPAPAQLALHVPDTAAFHSLCERDQAFRSESLAAELAPAIHETWRRLSRGRKSRRTDRDFEDLPADARRANLAAARRIPDILALVGLQVAAGAPAPGGEAEVRAHLERHLETLAEEEHRGWMSHLESEGWRYAEVRDDDARKHDCLRPYHELREEDREKDRATVRHFPDFVARVGFHVDFRQVRGTTR